MLCTIRRTDFLLVPTYVLVVVICMVFDITLTFVNNVSMVYWRTTGTYYGSSYRMIPAAFHGHTLTGMRVPILQNEDSSYGLRECNTSNIASTPNIADVYIAVLWILLVLGALYC